ncbi:uncharacterized protein LOC131942806 isoform X2 [Physella acuta]|nr:uncharacterized protein LOC131942806 isoform X2 [Physella acuta]XP_059158721.1 uncharacterized protein LOC131942806 isoform X2 [Physella acuta]XP_059158722.1 uncharacterized protein LOC131942806 isoform X2 [Physella acuta]
MTPTTDIKSPEKDVVIINEPVDAEKKYPSTVAKLNLFFIIVSGIIYWYFFTIKYLSYGPEVVHSKQALIPILGNNIAFVAISLHIFNRWLQGSKLTAAIAACVCIITSTYWVVAVNFLSTEPEQTQREEMSDVAYGLEAAAHYLQFIVGLMMVAEITYIT